jgi:hypothetical protein
VRRFQVLNDGRADMMLFETPRCGWTSQGIVLGTSKGIMTGGEVYISSSKQINQEGLVMPTTQEIFDDLPSKKLRLSMDFIMALQGLMVTQMRCGKNMISS